MLRARFDPIPGRWATRCRYNSGPQAPVLPPARAIQASRPSPMSFPITIVDSLLKQFSQSSQLGANAAYIEDLYEQYLVSPDSVGAKWKAYFDGFKGREAGDVPHSAVIETIAIAGKAAARGVFPATTGTGDERERSIGRLITAYRSRGHLAASLDPLGMLEQPDAPDLGLGFHKIIATVCSNSDMPMAVIKGASRGELRNGR